jgi:flagellar protein FliS
MRNEYADRYLTDKVTTASPAELIGLLYDAGVVAMQAAQAAIEGGSVADAHRHLVRAQDIVMELRCALRPEVGEIAGNLDDLYDFLYKQLVFANRKKDARAVTQSLHLFTPLRDAWASAVLGRTPAAAAVA